KMPAPVAALIQKRGFTKCLLPTARCSRNHSAGSRNQKPYVIALIAIAPPVVRRQTTVKFFSFLTASPSGLFGSAPRIGIQNAKKTSTPARAPRFAQFVRLGQSVSARKISYKRLLV